MLLGGRYKSWNDRNILALKHANFLITKENAASLHLFEKIQCSNPLKALIMAYKSGIYRQTFHGSVSLLLAIILKKV
jgi:hypothetical protein